MKYLLDTCICVSLIRRKSRTLREKIETCGIGDLGISSITAAELRYGADKSSNPVKNHAQLEHLFLTLPMLPFDAPATLHYGDIRAELERKGIPIGPMDFLIAAHARSSDLVLVTTNLGEFERVPGLTVEAWT